MDGWIALYVFMLAAFTGYEIIGRVPVILHTPLMSGSNFVHGIVLVGAMIVLGEAVFDRCRIVDQDDRYLGRSLHRGAHQRALAGQHEDLRPAGNELRNDPAISVRLSFGGAPLEAQILPLEITQRA